jgi:hypothetical protein
VRENARRTRPAVRIWMAAGVGSSEAGEPE